MTEAEIAAMRAAGLAYREAIATMHGDPNPANRDRVQALGMAFHHYVRLHGLWLLDQIDARQDAFFSGYDAALSHVANASRPMGLSARRAWKHYLEQ